MKYRRTHLFERKTALHQRVKWTSWFLSSFHKKISFLLTFFQTSAPQRLSEWTTSDKKRTSSRCFGFRWICFSLIWNTWSMFSELHERGKWAALKITLHQKNVTSHQHFFWFFLKNKWTAQKHKVLHDRAKQTARTHSVFAPLSMVAGDVHGAQYIHQLFYTTTHTYIHTKSALAPARAAREDQQNCIWGPTELHKIRNLQM